LASGFGIRSGSYKIHALSIFIFLVYRFHGNIDYFKKKHNSIFFQEIGAISHRSDQGNIGKKLFENATFGPEKLYQTTIAWLTELIKKVIIISNSL